MKTFLYIVLCIAIAIPLLTLSNRGNGAEEFTVAAAEYTPVVVEPVPEPERTPSVEIVELEVRVNILPDEDEIPAPEPAVRYALTDSERAVVESVVMQEAGGECYEGQMLVAQCILNGSERSNLRPDRTVVEYQYTAARPAPSQSVKDAVAAVFDRGEVVVEDTILWFYAPAGVTGTPWHESQRFVIEVGGHRFFAMW